MLALKILAGIIIIAGFAAALMSKNIVKQFELDKKVKLEHEGEMEVEEIAAT